MPNTNNKTIAKNTIFLSVRMVFVLIVSLYTSRVFLNLLGVVDYGVNNVVAGFVSMFTFLNTSLANGIQRFYNHAMGAGEVDGVKKVYNNALLIHAALAILVFILLETIGLWYLNNKMVIPDERFSAAFWLYQLIVISTIIIICQVPFNAAILAYERMNYYAYIGIIDVCLKLLLALCIPFVPYDKLIMMGAFTLVVTIINFLLNYIYCKKNFSELKSDFVFHSSLLKEMLTFSGWGFLGTLSTMLREQGLNLILNLFFGPVVNAARGIAYQVSSAIQNFVATVGVAAKPQMVSSYASGDSLRTMKLLFIMSKINFGVLAFFSLPIVLELDRILHLWLGNVVPDHTQSFIILILLTAFVNNLNSPVSSVVYATGKMKNYQLTFSLTTLFILPISYIALKMGCNAESVFVAYFCVNLFTHSLCLLILKKLVSFSLRKYMREILLPLFIMSISASMIPLLLRLFMYDSIVRFFLVTTVSLLSVGVSFYFICLDKSEKLMVNGLLKKVLQKAISK